jgi:erythromycin esterase
MRRYNEKAKRKIRFYGFDMQSPGLAVREVIRILREAAPERAAELVPRLTFLVDDIGSMAYSCFSEDRRRAATEALREAGEIVRGATWPDARERVIACLHATVAAQGEELMRLGYGGGRRDRSMAENARAFLDMEGPDGRIALWAHNGHVAKSGGEGMGYHLDKWFGKKHVVFGFAFGSGSFQAMDMGGKGLRDFTSPPPPAGSLDETLARTGHPLLAVDFSRAASGSPAGDWMREDHATRSAGAAFSDDPEELGFFSASCRIMDQFDALVFVANTTAARPNPDWRRLPPEERRDTNEETETKDKGVSLVDGLPSAWASRPRRRRPEYEITVEGNVACVRREGVPWEDDFGMLSHEFAAEPYRGKRVRLTAEARAAVTGEWARAFLTIAVHKGDPEWIMDSDSVLTFATTMDDPWTRDAWESRSIEIDVPANGGTVVFAFALSGNGSAHIRAIGFEVVS